ncbi:MAG: GNAT family N-acetyltransferase [Thermoplasmatota archaeon]
MATVEYAEGEADATAVADCFGRSGIRRPVGDVARIRAMIQNADIVYTAWSGGKMVGVVRALTDWNYCTYVSDLAVDRDWQRLGIGRELLERVRRAAGPQCKTILLASPEAMEYYPKLGYSKAENCWVVDRAS